MNLNDINYEKLRKKLYADSPYNLVSKEDNAYRNGVDYTIDELEEMIGGENV